MASLPVIVALDYSTAEQALAMAQRLSPQQVRVKVGKELFTRAGPALVEQLQQRGFDVFLDLKFHDIPNTVAGAVRAAVDLGVWMVNVHASGGRRMMEAAAEAAGQGAQKPLLIAVTVLTSLTAEDLVELGDSADPARRVSELAALASSSGMDGVVCSAAEAPALREAQGKDFCLVTPGIRPLGSDPGDQRRVLTPAQAMAAGSSYLVIGRPITASEDPSAVLDAIAGELAGFDGNQSRT